MPPPEQQFDPTQKVTEPVGAPQTAEPVKEEALADPTKIPGEVKKQLIDPEHPWTISPGEFTEAKPGDVFVQVEGSLTLAMRLVNSCVTFATRAVDSTIKNMTNLFGGQGVITFWRKPQELMKAIRAALGGATGISPVLLQEMVDIEGSTTLLGISIEEFQKQLANKDVRRIVYLSKAELEAGIKRAKGTMESEKFRPLREEVPAYADVATAERQMKEVEALKELLQRFSAGLEPIAEDFATAQTWGDTITPKLIEKNKAAMNKQTRWRTILYPGENIFWPFKTSSIGIQAQAPAVADAPATPATADLSQMDPKELEKDLRELLDSFHEIIQASDMLIAKGYELLRTVDRFQETMDMGITGLHEFASSSSPAQTETTGGESKT